MTFSSAFFARYENMWTTLCDVREGWFMKSLFVNRSRKFGFSVIALLLPLYNNNNIFSGERMVIYRNDTRKYNLPIWVSIKATDFKFYLFLVDVIFILTLMNLFWQMIANKCIKLWKFDKQVSEGSFHIESFSWQQISSSSF